MSIRDRMDQANVRIDQLVHLESAAPDGDLEYDLREFINEHAHEIGLVEEDGDELEEEELWDALYDKGMTSYWLAELRTPVARNFGPEESSYNFMFSWGWCHLGAVAAPTYEELVDKAIAWAEEQLEHDRRRDAETKEAS